MFETHLETDLFLQLQQMLRNRRLFLQQLIDLCHIVEFIEYFPHELLPLELFFGADKLNHLHFKFSCYDFGIFVAYLESFQSFGVYISEKTFKQVRVKLETLRFGIESKLGCTVRDQA
jgi:hypothetical protein